MSESGGYDAQFLQEPLEYFKCIICRLVLKDALMFIRCGHRVCSACFKQLKDHAESQQKDPGLVTGSKIPILCPHDRLVVEPDETVRDAGISRAILDFKVKCGNDLHGCAWSGELRELERHMNHGCVSRPKQNTVKLLEEITGRVEECERKLKEKDTVIMRLIKEKDDEVEHLRAEVRRCSAETESLKHLMDDFVEKINLNSSSSGSDQVSSNLNPDKNNPLLWKDEVFPKNVPHSQLLRLMNVSEYILGERTVFTWKISDYSKHSADAKRELFSPRFYVQPVQCCVCCLKLVWFGQRKGRIGVRLHMCSVYSADHRIRQVHSDNFEMAMRLEICDKRGDKKSHFISKEDMRASVRWEFGEYGDVHDTLSSGYGVDDLTDGCNVSRYLIGDVLTVECTLFESNPKECCSWYSGKKSSV